MKRTNNHDDEQYSRQSTLTSHYTCNLLLTKVKPDSLGSTYQTFSLSPSHTCTPPSCESNFDIYQPRNRVSPASGKGQRRPKAILNVRSKGTCWFSAVCLSLCIWATCQSPRSIMQFAVAQGDDPAANPDATTAPPTESGVSAGPTEVPTTTINPNITTTTTTAVPCTVFDTSIAGGQQAFFPSVSIKGISNNATIPGLKIDACFSETTPAATKFPATGRPSATLFPEVVFSYPGVSAIETSLALMNWINQSCIRIVLSPKTITTKTATATLEAADAAQLGYCPRLFTSPLPIVVMSFVADPTNETALDLGGSSSAADRIFDYTNAIQAAGFFELQAVGAASRSRCAPSRLQSVFGSIHTVAPFAFWDGYVGAVVGTIAVLSLFGIGLLVAGYILRVEMAGGKRHPRQKKDRTRQKSHSKVSDEANDDPNAEMKTLVKGGQTAKVMGSSTAIDMCEANGDVEGSHVGSDCEGGDDTEDCTPIIGEANSSPQWRRWYLGSAQPVILGLSRVYSAIWIHLLLAVAPGALFSASQLLVIDKANDEGGGTPLGVIGFIIFAPLVVAAPAFVYQSITRVAVNVRYFGKPGAIPVKGGKINSNNNTNDNQLNRNNNVTTTSATAIVSRRPPNGNNEDQQGRDTMVIVSRGEGGGPSAETAEHHQNTFYMSEANASEVQEDLASAAVQSSVIAVHVASPDSNNLSSSNNSEDDSFEYGPMMRAIVAWLYPSTVTLPRSTSRLFGPIASARYSTALLAAHPFANTAIIGLLLGLPSSEKISSCTGLLAAAACLYVLLCVFVGIVRPHRARAENMMVTISYLFTALELWLCALHASLGEPTEDEEASAETIRGRLSDAIKALWVIHVIITAAGRVLMPLWLLFFEDFLTTDVAYEVPSSSDIKVARNPILLGMPSSSKEIDIFVLCFTERRRADEAERERRRQEAEAKRAAAEAAAVSRVPGDDGEDMASPRNEDQPSKAITRLESGRWNGAAETVNPLPHQSEKAQRTDSKKSRKARISAGVSPGSRSIHRNPYADLDADPLGEGSTPGKASRRSRRRPKRREGLLGDDSYSDCSTEDMQIGEAREESRDSGPRPLSARGSLNGTLVIFGNPSTASMARQEERIPLTGAPIETNSVQNSSDDEGGPSKSKKKTV